MAWLRETSGVVLDSYTCSVVVPAGGYPVGRLLVLGVGTSLSTSLTVAAADAKGNTWTLTQMILAQTGSSKGTASQLHCIVGVALAAGDLITVTVVTSPSPPARFICVVQEFDDVVSGADVGSSYDGAGQQELVLTSGLTPTTTSQSQLVVGAMLLINSGRTFTPGAGFTAGAKVITGAVSGDRAIIMQWKHVVVQDVQESFGAVESKAFYGATVQTYALVDEGDVRTGNAKVWDGVTWSMHPAKVWMGSAWQPHAMKAWDGADWRKAK